MLAGSLLGLLLQLGLHRDRTGMESAATGRKKKALDGIWRGVHGCNCVASEEKPEYWRWLSGREREESKTNHQVNRHPDSIG